MPSTYAHYRMGKEAAEELTGEAWHTLSMYRQLYLIGLHGPDILFYYRPLKSNVINGIENCCVQRYNVPIIMLYPPFPSQQ